MGGERELEGWNTAHKTRVHKKCALVARCRFGQAHVACSSPKSVKIVKKMQKNAKKCTRGGGKTQTKKLRGKKKKIESCKNTIFAPL